MNKNPIQTAAELLWVHPDHRSGCILLSGNDTREFAELEMKVSRLQSETAMCIYGVCSAEGRTYMARISNSADLRRYWSVVRPAYASQGLAVPPPLPADETEAEAVMAERVATYKELRRFQHKSHPLRYVKVLHNEFVAGPEPQVLKRRVVAASQVSKILKCRTRKK